MPIIDSELAKKLCNEQHEKLVLFISKLQKFVGLDQGKQMQEEHLEDKEWVLKNLVIYKASQLEVQNKLRKLKLDAENNKRQVTP